MGALLLEVGRLHPFIGARLIPPSGSHNTECLGMVWTAVSLFTFARWVFPISKCGLGGALERQNYFLYTIYCKPVISLYFLWYNVFNVLGLYKNQAALHKVYKLLQMYEQNFLQKYEN